MSSARRLFASPHLPIRVVMALHVIESFRHPFLMGRTGAHPTLTTREGALYLAAVDVVRLFMTGEHAFSDLPAADVPEPSSAGPGVGSVPPASVPPASAPPASAPASPSVPSAPDEVEDPRFELIRATIERMLEAKRRALAARMAARRVNRVMGDKAKPDKETGGKKPGGKEAGKEAGGKARGGSELGGQEESEGGAE